MEDRIAISRLKQSDFKALETLVIRYQVPAAHAAYLIVRDRARTELLRSHIPDGDGWVTLDLSFDSFAAARSHLLGLGRAVEVLEPETLRKSLVDIAEQIVGFYENRL